MQGQGSARCGVWLNTIVDVYFRKMECSADNGSLHVYDFEPVEYHGHSYHPVVVSWYTDPPGSMLRIHGGRASLESLLAPLIGAESVFRHPETGQALDLFPRSLVTQAILGNDQIRTDPPVELVAIDLAVGNAKAEYNRQLRALGATSSTPRNPEIDRLNHAGPVQQTLVPLARAISERCREQLQTAPMIAELAANPGCQRALPIDPFLRALFGEQRLGQAVTIQAEARAANPERPWYQGLFGGGTTPTPTPSAGPARPAR